MPETVSVAMDEIAADRQEGLLALVVGTGLQVMHQLMKADLSVVCGSSGKHAPVGERCATAGRPARSLSAGGGCRCADRDRAE